MRISIVFLGCLAWLFPWSVWSQATEIYGVVKDGKTREVLPFVNVRFKNSLKATQTDLNGIYSLKTLERVDTVVFSYLGYNTLHVPLKRGKSQELNVDMGSGNIQLSELTIGVKKRRKKVVDTLAMYVYEQVVKNKPKNNPANLNEYHYEDYSKAVLGLLNAPDKFINRRIFKPFRFVFENRDTLEDGQVAIPGLIKETVSDVHYRKKPELLRTIVKSDVVSGVDNPSLSKLASWQLKDLSAYEDMYIIAAHSFESPFSPNARVTYRYYLTDTQKIEGRVSYKLNFIAKNKEDIAFVGYAWIDSATWGIRAINMQPNDKSNLNFINEYHIVQEYTLLNGKSWFMQRESLQAVGSLFKKEKNKLSILVQKSTYRRNIAEGPPPNDTLYRNEKFITLPDATKHSRDYWDTARFVPLEKVEQRIYFNSDTIKTVPAWKRYEWLINLGTTAYLKAGPVEFGRFYKFVSRNNIEDIRLRMGIRTNRRFSKTFHFFGYAAYGLRDKVLKYELDARILLPRINNNWHAFGLMYRYDLNQLGQLNQLINFDNIVTLMLPSKFSKIMLIRQFDVMYEREWMRGVSTIMTYGQKVFYPIPGVFDFTRKTADGKVEQLDKFKTTEFGLNARYCYDDKYYEGMFYRYFIAGKYPVIELTYNLGVKRLADGDFNYHKLVLSLNQRLSTRKVGYSRYSIFAGKIFGDAPYPTWFITAGNYGWLYNKFNYALLKEFEFVTDQYVSVWWDHYFDGFFLNKIPGVKKLRIREHLSMKMLWGNFSGKRAALIDLPAGINTPSRIPYIEVGFGFSNILKIFRVDFCWRVTYRDTPGAPNFGVRVGFAPTF